MVQLILVLGATSQQTPLPFTFAEGGRDWLGLCVTGQEQSPIDIPESPDNLPLPALVTIDNTVFSEVYVSSEISPFSQINATGFLLFPISGSVSAMLNGTWLEGSLTQTHVHTPGMHLFDGVRYPAEIHIVASVNETDYHELEIALRVRYGSDRSPFFDALINQEPVDIEGLLAGYLDDYYFYNGSMDVPVRDCEEGSAWIVTTAFIEATWDQITYFTEKYVDDLSFSNGRGAVRAVQPLNDRVIYHVEPQAETAGL